MQNVVVNIRHDVSMQELRGLYCEKSLSTPPQMKMPDIAHKIFSITKANSKTKTIKLKKRITSSAKRTELRHHLRHGAVVTCVHFFGATLNHVIAFVVSFTLLLCSHFCSL